MVFASVLNQLPPKLKVALKSPGLDDPRLLMTYPRSTVKELHVQGVVVGTRLFSSFPSSLPFSMGSGIAQPLYPMSPPISPIVSMTGSLCVGVTQPQGLQVTFGTRVTRAARSPGPAPSSSLVDQRNEQSLDSHTTGLTVIHTRFVPSVTDNRGNGAALNKLMSTRFPSSAVLMELATKMKARRLRTIVEWAPRAHNREADSSRMGTLRHSTRKKDYMSQQTLSRGISYQKRWRQAERQNELFKRRRLLTGSQTVAGNNLGGGLRRVSR